MTDEELKQKAEDFLKRYFRVSNDEFEKAKENDEVIVNTIKMLVDFATETTKELQAYNEKLTQHLGPQAMTALFEQVEEEIELEQKVKKLETYNEKLLNSDIEKHNKIVELQNRNSELAGQKASLERWLGEAKKILKKYHNECPAKYSFEDMVEQFLKECE